AFASVPLRELHDAAKRLAGATLNDAVLAVVAGALRCWLQRHHGQLGRVRIRVPVSLHEEGDDAGNRDSFFSVSLPLNEPDPVARLRAAQAATAVRKADHDAEQMDHLLRALGGISPRLGRFCARLEDSPRRFALSVSNVPGPPAPVTVLGAPVESVHSLAEIGERHALRVAVVSMAGRLGFGLCADPAIVEGLGEMAAGVEAEAEALVRAA
ncbi:MAG: WS/DGAT domain-containing protein, partial [Actinomycetota bacterium]|nr:WS/DGAT domain-containing protein [Actinomycetota bacterium]